MKRKIFIKKLRFYLALKEDCDAKHNLGVVGVGTAGGENGVLDAKQELCDLIQQSGGDFANASGFVISRNGRTSYGNGSGYRGWKNFGSRNAALNYLEQYFTLVECQEGFEALPATEGDARQTEKRSVVEPDLGKSEHSAQNHVHLLTAIGFKDVAQWEIVDERKIVDVGDDAEVWQELKEPKNALYAFSVGDEVLYIGKTARSIEKRFIGYRDPGNTQATNRKCHDEIRHYLDDKKTVRIMVLPDQTYLHWGDFRINLAAGLEDSLVEKLQPPLNGKNAKRIKTESEQLEEDSQTPNNL